MITINSTRNINFSKQVPCFSSFFVIAWVNGLKSSKEYYAVPIKNIKCQQLIGNQDKDIDRTLSPEEKEKYFNIYEYIDKGRFLNRDD